MVKKIYLGDIAILTETIGGDQSGYKVGFTHRDHLGSVVTITDETGNVIDNKSYDPFGKPRLGNMTLADPNRPPTLAIVALLSGYELQTHRGFTDHEHLDDAQLIHMNGRVYDYNLGRFLSVDPLIQSPGNSQSFNPYSYIMNNPLAGTDPSGYEAVTSKTDVADMDAGKTYKMKQKKLGSRISKSVGTVSKDSKGNLHVSSNGGSKGQAQVAGSVKKENAASNGGDDQSKGASNINGLQSRSKTALSGVGNDGGAESTNGDTPPPIDEELIKPPKPATLTLAFDGAGDTSLQGNKDFDDVVNSLNGDVEKFNSGVFDFPLPDATERALKFFRENLGGKLFLIGYSSGGADAIKLTNILADMGLPNVSGLVTIDPRSGHRLFVKSSRSIPNGIPAINFRQTKATPFGGSKLTYRKGYSGSGVRNVDLTGQATHNSIAGFVSRNYRDDVNRILQQGK